MVNNKRNILGVSESPGESMDTLDPASEAPGMAAEPDMVSCCYCFENIFYLSQKDSFILGGKLIQIEEGLIQ